MNWENVMIFVLIFPLLASFISLLIGRRNEKQRDIFNVIVTGLVFFCVVILYKPVTKAPIELWVPGLMGTGLHLKLDLFSYLFIFITALAWFLVTIYSPQYMETYHKRNRYYFFYLLTLWSTIGVFLSENLLNLFTFFEIMSFTAYPLIIHHEDEYSHDAGKTYIIMAVAGGMILLLGLFLLADYSTSLEISQIRAAFRHVGSIKYLISSLIIVGFGVKAGMIPLHIWLPKAHPAAPAPFSSILSGVLLKTGIFGIILTVEIMLEGDFAVSVVLFIAGLVNVLIGGFIALFQTSFKRLLAYSSISQIGYILLGIGLMGMLGDHRTLAVYGTLYHVLNHAIYKIILFLFAGVVYMMTHNLSLNIFGGIGRNQRFLKIVFIISMLGIIGMPGFNGFASKSMLHHALIEAKELYPGSLFTLAEVLFTIGSSFTVAYLLKLYFAIFVDKSSNDFSPVQIRFSKTTLFPLTVLAGLIVYIGINPGVVVRIFNEKLIFFGQLHPLELSFFTLENILSSALTIGIGTGIYFFFVKKFLWKRRGEDWLYLNPIKSWFNLERHFYKPIFKAIFWVLVKLLGFIDQLLVRLVNTLNLILSLFGCLTVNCLRRLECKSQQIPNVKIRDELIDIGYSLKTITYSLFSFGIVLTVCLVVLILVIS